MCWPMAEVYRLADSAGLPPASPISRFGPVVRVAPYLGGRPASAGVNISILRCGFTTTTRGVRPRLPGKYSRGGNRHVQNAHAEPIRMGVPNGSKGQFQGVSFPSEPSLRCRPLTAGSKPWSAPVSAPAPAPTGRLSSLRRPGPWPLPSCVREQEAPAGTFTPCARAACDHRPRAKASAPPRSVRSTRSGPLPGALPIRRSASPGSAGR